MMWDLVVGAFVIAALSFCTFFTGLRVARHWSKRAMSTLCVAVLPALLLFVFRYYGTWQMARLIPFSNAIILANWIPLGGAFFAGVVLGQKESPRWRRGVLASLVLIVSIYSVLCCFQGSLPLKPDATYGSTRSRQSWASSCGPYCAALLLQHHGIDASELEMIRLCLTSHRGCPALGLYRGLKLKTASTDWDVQVVTCTVDELITLRGPLLLRVVILPMMVQTRSKLTKERRSYQHIVLLNGIDERGYLRIDDPAVPKGASFNWRIENLQKQWLGEALRLVPRDGRQPQD